MYTTWHGWKQYLHVCALSMCRNINSHDWALSMHKNIISYVWAEIWGKNQFLTFCFCCRLKLILALDFSLVGGGKVLIITTPSHIINAISVASTIFNSIKLTSLQLSLPPNLGKVVHFYGCQKWQSMRICMLQTQGTMPEVRIWVMICYEYRIICTVSDS